MTFRFIIAGCILFLTSAAQAQTWTSNTQDTGALLYGSAGTAGRMMGFNCTAPSQGGRSLMETGDHESNRTKPFSMIFSLSAQLIDPMGTNPQLTSASITLDGKGYGFPPIEYSDFFGDWSVHMGLSGGTFWSELAAAKSIAFDTGRGALYDVPVDGLNTSLRTAISYCLNGWQQAGNPVPPDLRTWMQPASQPAPNAAQAASAPNLRQVLDPYVQRQCQGSFSYNIQNLAFGDLDGDGQTDILLDWGEVRCQGPMGPRPFCGAANCSIDILLSSKNYAPGEGYLGVGVRTVALNDGRTGFLMGGTANVCATGACDIPFVWDGTKFRKLY